MCKRTASHGRPEAATYLISVAGSAGALAPLRRFVGALTPELRAAVVIALHNSPRSALHELLRSWTDLPVMVTSTGLCLRPGCIYVAAPGCHLAVNPDATLTVSEAEPVRNYRPSADWLFESASASFRERHVAIVLSGMLWDGAAAVPAVRARGGAVIVQAPSEARFGSMPEAAIATGRVTTVLPVDEMHQAILEHFAARDPLADRSTWEAPFREGS